MVRGLLLSTADTELLSAYGSGAPWQIANPSRLEPDAAAELARGAAFTVIRLLGGRQTWPAGLDAVLATGTPVVVLGGESAPDAVLQALSTVAPGVASQALAYLADGGVD